MLYLNKIEPLYFLISLCIGLFYNYITSPNPTIIYKYPTPENSNKILYKDASKNCYKYQSNLVKCPKNKNLINEIPIQYFSK